MPRKKTVLPETPAKALRAIFRYWDAKGMMPDHRTIAKDIDYGSSNILPVLKPLLQGGYLAIDPTENRMARNLRITPKAKRWRRVEAPKSKEKQLDLYAPPPP